MGRKQSYPRIARRVEAFALTAAMVIGGTFVEPVIVEAGQRSWKQEVTAALDNLSGAMTDGRAQYAEAYGTLDAAYNALEPAGSVDDLTVKEVAVNVLY